MPDTIDDPLLHLTFDEGTGTNAANSGSAVSADGTLINGPTWVAPGQVGAYALSFDGSNDYVTVGHPASLEVDFITFASWVKPAVNNAYQFWISRDDGATNRHYFIGMDSGGNLFINLWNSSGTVQDGAASTAIPVGVWTHLAVTYDGINIKTYMNGVLIRTRPLAGTLKKNTTQPIIIGAENSSAVFFNGGMDDVRIYGRDLNQAEITELYNYSGIPIDPLRLIHTGTGSDSNDGTTDSPWATWEPAITWLTAHVGATTRLGINAPSDRPLYVSGSNPRLAGISDGLTIESDIEGEYADVRYWELVEGDTAVPYDTYYSTSGHPNVYVLVTRQDACIWEFMGGRGDNLKWFDHLVSCGITPSATYNNATNLSTLNSTPWSWWTGTDGADYVTLFNCNGSPAGRQFAVPFHAGQSVGGSCLEVGQATVKGLCLGGFSGCFPTTSSNFAGTVLQAKNGAIIDGNILYGGCSHAGLSGDDDSVTWRNNIYREGPRWMGGGGYTTQVWFSEASSQPPTFENETCTYSTSVAGSVTGSNFYDSPTVGITNQIANSLIGHGAAITAWIAGLGDTTSEIVMTGCYFGGTVTLPIAATNCTLGTIGTSGAFNSGTLLYCPVNHSTDVPPLTISDSIIHLNLAGTNGSHYPPARCELTIQSCTVIEGDYLSGVAGVRPILNAELGALGLTVNDCILSLPTASLTNAMDLDDTDTLDANRNIYIGLSSALHANLTSSAASSNRTLAQTQALGFETGSVIDADGSGSKLRADFTIPPSSIAVGKATVRVDAPDRTGVVFASRSATGAYEPTADRPSFRPPSRSTFDRAKITAELFVDELDKRLSRGEGTFKQISGSTASYNIGQTLRSSAGNYLPADGAACDAVLIQNLIDVPTGTEVANVALLVAGPVVIEQDALEFADGADQSAQIAALLAKRIRCVRAPANTTQGGV